MSSDFATGERQWRARLGTLRQVVRQELVARQVAAHLPDTRPLRVLDVGCEQGTQLLRLAWHGHHATGLDSSATLLADLTAARADRRSDLTTSLASHGLSVHTWYGVGVFTDALPADAKRSLGCRP